MFKTSIGSVMRCIALRRIKNPSFPDDSPYEFIDVACGKCYNCLVNRRNGWLFRLFHESLASVSTWFLTLTYNDDYCDGVLHRDHLQKFIKRLRNHGVSMKYYAIGEYGTNTLRPHYHLIAFLKRSVPGFSSFDRFVSDCWKFGYSMCVIASPAAMNYVLHYHVRPKYPFGDKDPENRKKKTFCAFSKGLGLSSFFDADGNFKKSIASMLESSTMRSITDYLGRNFVLPRYYVKKAEELGLPVCHDFKPNYSPYANPMNCVLKLLEPSLEFYSDGHPYGISEERYNSLMNDYKCLSDKRLKRFNYQQKNSI